ncbi:MAG TPA: COQ9 family protein [Aliidongia sp.]|nr:COQ9 family protein [Aliidongia sp.]
MSANAEITAAKDRLLEATLPNVLFDGWSLAALKAGAQTIALPEAEIAVLFPDGGVEAGLWLDDWADRQMLNALEAMDLGALKVRERVAAAVRARLTALAPHREAVRRAISLKASPWGAAKAAEIVYRTVDAIWYAAGDTATDFNFYTKRALLAAAYGPTVLYWLNDSSEDSADTFAFLDRRLADVMKIPKLTDGVKRAVRHLTGPFEFLRQARR